MHAMREREGRGEARCRRRAALAFAAPLLACLVVPEALDAQTAERPSEARRISISWVEAPIRDVLMAFSVASGKSIVAGPGVQGAVTADINDRPWDVALRAILSAQGLVAFEDEHGIVRVDAMEDLHAGEAIEPILTRSYRISYVDAEEIRATLTPLLSERGSISVGASTNTVVVSDIERVHRAIGGLVRRP